MATTKKKAFDCVEFKRQAQARIEAEWERRRGEFASYEDFLHAKVNESEWQRAFWAKFRDTDRRAD